MATANFNINAENGWTAVTAAGVDFIRIRTNTPRHAFFVTTSPTLPAASVIGYKVLGEEFFVDVPVSDNFYVRFEPNLPQDTRVDVFYILTTP